MENRYFERLDTTISYRDYLKKIEEEREKMLEAIECNMNECKHEILISFGHMQDFRCYGIGEKYYCPFCSKRVVRYLSDGLIDEKKHLVVNLKNFNVDTNKVKIIFPEIQINLQEYLKNNKNANVIEIKEYISSLDIDELFPKVKKINF